MVLLNHLEVEIRLSPEPKRLQLPTQIPLRMYLCLNVGHPCLTGGYLNNLYGYMAIEGRLEVQLVCLVTVASTGPSWTFPLFLRCHYY